MAIFITLTFVKLKFCTKCAILMYESRSIVIMANYLKKLEILIYEELARIG